MILASICGLEQLVRNSYLLGVLCDDPLLLPIPIFVIGWEHCFRTADGRVVVSLYRYLPSELFIRANAVVYAVCKK